MKSFSYLHHWGLGGYPERRFRCGICSTIMVKAGAKLTTAKYLRRQMCLTLSEAKLFVSAGASEVQIIDYEKEIQGIHSTNKLITQAPNLRYHPLTPTEYEDVDWSLKNICRWMIRRHLLSVNHVNLLITVPKLGLPTRLKENVQDMPFNRVSCQ